MTLQSYKLCVGGWIKKKHWNLHWRNFKNKMEELCAVIQRNDSLMLLLFSLVKNPSGSLYRREKRNCLLECRTQLLENSHGTQKKRNDEMSSSYRISMWTLPVLRWTKVNSVTSSHTWKALASSRSTSALFRADGYFVMLYVNCFTRQRLPVQCKIGDLIFVPRKENR